MRLEMILYSPKTPETQAELARRVAQVHAQAAMEKVKSISCPTGQKVQLIDRIRQTQKSGG